MYLLPSRTLTERLLSSLIGKSVIVRKQLGSWFLVYTCCQLIFNPWYSTPLSLLKPFHSVKSFLSPAYLRVPRDMMKSRLWKKWMLSSGPPHITFLNHFFSAVWPQLCCLMLFAFTAHLRLLLEGHCEKSFQSPPCRGEETGQLCLCILFML